MINWIDFYHLETFSTHFRAGRSHFRAFKKRFFSKNFAKFHDFVFLSATDFGPDSFGRKSIVNHVCALKVWAEVSVWSTLNAHFGPIDTAEMSKLLPRTFEHKLCSPNQFVMIFTCLQAFLNFMSGFRPKKCFNQKTFSGTEVSKWYKELISSV